MNENILYNWGKFFTKDKIELFEQRWEPEKIKAIVIIIHGLGEHSSRYENIAKFLVKEGYGVETWDHRGHGKSKGLTAYINSFDEYLDDLEIFIERVKTRHPDLPIFILGHSMGGAIAAAYGIERDQNFKGMLLSASAIKISKNISPFMVKLAIILSKIFPKLKTIKLDSNDISHDPEIVKKYQTDPLVYNGGIPARTGAELNGAVTRVQSQALKFNMPVLIMHGSGDKMADPEGSKTFYQNISSKDKTLKIYDDFFHEIMNEIEKERVYSDILNWLEERV